MAFDGLEHGSREVPPLTDHTAELRMVRFNDSIHDFGRSRLVLGFFLHRLLDERQKDDLTEIHHLATKEGKLAIQPDGRGDGAR